MSVAHTLRFCCVCNTELFLSKNGWARHKRDRYHMALRASRKEIAPKVILPELEEEDVPARWITTDDILEPWRSRFTLDTSKGGLYTLEGDNGYFIIK